MAEPAEVGGKDLAQIHAPSQASCWLLTHRFKPTKIQAALVRADLVKLRLKVIVTVAPLFSCVLIMPIVGCSTGAQKEAARIQAVEASSDASTRACLQNIQDNPEYAPLKSKMVWDIDARSTPLQMLNDKTSPNKQEMSLLYKSYGEIQDCRKMQLEGVSKAHPLIVLTLVEGFAASDKVWAQLTGGRLTWGQFNERRQDILTETRGKIIQANAQIGSRLQEQHQSEIARRQRAAEAVGAALQDWSNQQQQIANRSRTIDCRYIFDTMHCNSY